MKTMKHDSLINALMKQGLNPERDPTDASRFLVQHADVQGSWSKNHDGRVMVAITMENDKVQGSVTINDFLRSLKRPIVKQTRQKRAMN